MGSADNRRWARRAGLAHVSLGHRHGVEHIERVLWWCAEIGIDQVTIFVLSLDNLRQRDDEVDYLMGLADPALERLMHTDSPWRIHLAGRVDILPAPTVLALKRAAEVTSDRARHLTLAIGYDGRAEVVDAVRSLVETEAAVGSGHPHQRGAPVERVPDVAVRTLGVVLQRRVLARSPLHRLPADSAHLRCPQSRPRPGFDLHR